MFFIFYLHFISLEETKISQKFELFNFYLFGFNTELETACNLLYPLKPSISRKLAFSKTADNFENKNKVFSVSMHQIDRTLHQIESH